MTKKDKEILTAYLNSNKNNLYQCYSSFSYEKQKAFDYCINLMAKYNGHSLKIISYNIFQFTCGFIYVDDEGENHLMHITKSQDKDIKLIKDEYSDM